MGDSVAAKVTGDSLAPSRILPSLMVRRWKRLGRALTVANTLSRITAQDRACSDPELTDISTADRARSDPELTDISTAALLDVREEIMDSEDLLQSTESLEMEEIGIEPAFQCS